MSSAMARPTAAEAEIRELPALDIIFAWYGTLKPSAKEKLSVENLHSLSKMLVEHYAALLSILDAREVVTTSASGEPIDAEGMPLPYSNKDLRVKRRTLDAMRDLYEKGQDVSMADGDWEDLRTAINDDERWLATIDQLRRTPASEPANQEKAL